jgi:Tfp pilus assembly protein PilO
MTIVLLVVMGAIVVIGAGALYWLRFQEMAALEEELAILDRNVAEAQKKSKDIKGLETKVASLKEKIDVIRGQIPVFSPKEENDQFADTVDNLRKKSRVNIVDVRYSAVRGTTPGDDIPPSIFRARYEVKVTGGFFQLLSFMNLLETERRFLVVDNIKLLAGAAVEKSGAPPVRELQMNISTYMQRPPPAPPGPTAQKPAEKVATEVPPEERRPSTPIPD